MKNSAKILMVLQKFPSDSPFLRQKFEGLIQKGLNVHMFCLDRSQAPVLESADLKKRTHFSLPASPLKAGLLVPFLLIYSLFKHPKKVIRYFQYGIHNFPNRIFKVFYRDAMIILLDPAILHFEFGTLALNRMYLRDVIGCKVVVSFRGYDLNYAGLETDDYYKEVWEKADVLHLLGNDLWQRAQMRGCPSDKKHVLIPPAIDIDFFNPSSRDDNPKVGTRENPVKILSVSRLAWKKGYEYALQTIKLLKDQGIQCSYKIVGSGDYREAVSFARHQLDLEKEVELVGAKSQTEIRQMMEDADIFLHAAVSEGFCNAVLEAQAMKLPVVCSDADGLPENIVDGKTGFVVPRRDPIQMAEKIRLLAQERKLCKSMGEAGRRRALKHFDIEKQITAFEVFYREAAGLPSANRELKDE